MAAPTGNVYHNLYEHFWSRYKSSVYIPEVLLLKWHRSWNKGEEKNRTHTTMQKMMARLLSHAMQTPKQNTPLGIFCWRKYQVMKCFGIVMKIFSKWNKETIRNKTVLKKQVVKKWPVSVERYYWEKNLATSSCSHIMYAECSLLEFIIPSLNASKINVCVWAN